MKAAGDFLAFLFAPTVVCQTVSEVRGNIVFTDVDGRSREITSGHLDSQPSLCSDNPNLVFVRSTPNRKTDTGLGNIELTEIWIAQTDGNKSPKGVLSGHAGRVYAWTEYGDGRF